jgi:3-oxoadipate enol-lactonase
MTDMHYLDPSPANACPVLLLHGLGATSVSWTMQFPALSEAGFRPLAPDAPGFGESLYDGKGWSIHKTAERMAGLLQELGASPAYVVGLSMGGVIAQQLVHEYPHLVKKLVLVSTFAVLRPVGIQGWLYFIQRFLVVNTLGLGSQAKLVARRIFPDPEHQFLRDMLITIIKQSDPRSYRAAMRSLALFDSRKWLSDINVPTLVVTGTDDTTVDPGRQKILASGIPGAGQVVVPNAGHALPIDQPKIFNQLLLDFLKD